MLKNDPKQQDACEPLRNIYEQLHEWDKAIEVTQVDQQRDKSDRARLIAHYYCEIATQELQKNNIFRAEENVKQAVKAYPQSARVQVLQGDLAYTRGERLLALEAYQKAIAQDSRLLGMLFNQLMHRFQQKEELEQLYRFVQQTFAKSKDVRLFTYLLQLARKLGKLSEMRTQVDEHLVSGRPTLKTLAYASEVLTLAWQENNQCDMSKLQNALARVAANQPEFQCTHCGYKMHDYLWRCPACHQWDTVGNV